MTTPYNGLSSPLEARHCECGNLMAQDDEYRDGDGNWICPDCLANAPSELNAHEDGFYPATEAL